MFEKQERKDVVIPTNLGIQVHGNYSGRLNS